MFKKIIVLLFLMSSSISGFAQQHIFSFGPLFNLNINEKKVQPSLGLEVAYWNLEGLPYSIDFGMDFQKGKKRIYTELQTGIGILGVSGGPYLEIKKETRQAKLGLQNAIWAGYFGGVMMRWRHSSTGNEKAPGIYAKIPYGKGLYESEDGNANWNDLFD